jgi:DNA polymerase-1
MTESVPDRLMLLDGMGLLVRCSRAAARQAPMTFEGRVTGPLTLFTGSLTARLIRHEPTHVVVCWEGLPEANWRRQMYSHYKPRATTAYRGLLSADEDLIREFCAAAGLRQDWSPEFEGDDMIAAWWRMARQARPDAEVLIVSDDRDLLQLCDKFTVVWPLSEEREGPATVATVKQTWGCPPEHLPLLRALIGDRADGIPGIPGIGAITAEALVRACSDHKVLLDGLGAGRGEDDGAAGMAELYRCLMDLREPLKRPYPNDDSDAPLMESARWLPAEASPALLEFLQKHGMQRMTKRLMSGNLPWPPPS